MINSLISHLIGESPLLTSQGKTVLVFPEFIILCAAIWFLTKRYSVLLETYSRLPALFRYAAILLVVGGAGGVIFSGNVIAALAAYKAWILFPLLMFFLFTATPRGGQYARWALYGATFLELAYSLVSKHGHSADWRLIGTFSSPNYLAMLLGPALILLVLDLVRTNGKAKAYSLLVFAVICTALGLLATKSVGGMVALSGAALFCLYRLPLGRGIQRAIWIGVVVLGIIGGSLLAARVQSGRANSVTSRIQIWHTAAVLGSRQPITGIGFTNFPQQYVDNVVSIIGYTPIEWSVPLPHNLYLAFWLYTGALGLAGLVTLIWEACKKEYGILFLPFLSLCVHGLFDTPYFYTPIVYVFWLTLAIGLIDVWQKRQITFLESSKR